MGIYSTEAANAFLKSDKLYTKASEDYYKSKMFYGNAQVLVDARSESEAKYLSARAINDFDVFCNCYKVDNGEKLNGIVLKPYGEMSNEFIACTTDEKGNKAFDHVIIREGKILSAEKKTIVNENWGDIQSKMQSQNPEVSSKAKEDKGDWNDIKIKMQSQNPEAYSKAKEDKGNWNDIKSKINNESTNLAREF